MARSYVENHCPHKDHAQRQVIGRGMLGCRQHWYELPKSVRDVVWQLQARSPERHRDLVLRIIEKWVHGEKVTPEILNEVAA